MTRSADAAWFRPLLGLSPPPASHTVDHFHLAQRAEILNNPCQKLRANKKATGESFVYEGK
jgi:hypothetical protein